MKYLHDHHILHRDLKPANIFLDENLFPRLADFGLSKSIDNTSSDKHNQIKSGLKGTYAYCSPEILKKEEYTIYGDIYAFGIIVFEIMTSQIIFKGWNLYKLLAEVLNDYRPEFNCVIPYCYRKLIEKCWSKKKYDRPDFGKICDLLKTNPDFITDTVDQIQFLNYVEMIDNYLNIKETKSKNHSKVENQINNKVSKEQIITDEKKLSEKSEDCFINMNNFEKEELILKREFTKLYKIKNLNTGDPCIAQISTIKIKQVSDDEIHNISTELHKISQLDNPSVLKFIGYSLVNFKSKRKPVIITEYSSNGTLDQIIQLERDNNEIIGWDYTKKLINIFGIASGMNYLHSHDIIHRDLNPESIFLDDYLFPKICDFGLSTRFLSNDTMSHRSVTGIMATPVYTAPESLQFNEYSKSTDVYSFAYIVYEILTSQVPFSEIENKSKIYDEIVQKGNRPKFNKKIPECYRKLIEICWSQNPNDRPSFDQIINWLKNDQDFITDKISKNDYLKYVDLIEKNQKKVNEKEKLKSNDIKNSTISKEINEKVFENSDTNDIKYASQIDNSTDFIQNISCENEQINQIVLNDKQKINSNETQKNILLNRIINERFESFNNVILTNKHDSIDNLISSRKAKDLMMFLNEKCSSDEKSFVFDKCYSEDLELFLDLCKEGISMNNPVAHHKYAIFLIYNKDNLNEQSKIMNYKKAQNHLEESIKQGFAFSCFLHARISHEYFHKDNKAFEIAREGAKRNEKYSKCLLGYFIAHGIGTKKDHKKGVEMMLESQAEDYYELLSTDIGIYYAKLSEKSEQNKESNEKLAFSWFEKAFNMKQTKATINNYGICYLKGIDVNQNIEKAKEIFSLGIQIKDPNSMYHMVFILEEKDPDSSMELYKMVSNCGHFQSQLKCAIFDSNNEKSLNCFHKAAELKSIFSQEILAKKYSIENDEENTYKYMKILIDSGNFRVPLDYAISLYNLKHFNQAFGYFSILSECNHPIAKYFIGIMKFYGIGCSKNHDESYKIMPDLASKGINKAFEFIELKFNH